MVSDITVLSPSDSTPTGCAVYTVGTSATVFLDIKGRIDIDKEIDRAKVKLQKADETIQKQKKILGAEDYEAKVSEAVKEGEKEKLRAAETEARNLEMSINQFQTLKLS
jgi:valyl-tRNA synthetase